MVCERFGSNVNCQMLIVFLFLLGLSVGSFLNVVIDRLPAGRNLWGRSKADCCGKTLGFYDLIPLLSFLTASGKCRACHQPVSFYYPLIEALTAFLTLAAFFYFPLPYSLFHLVNFYFLIVYFFMDLKYGLVSLPIVLVNLLFVFSFQIYFLSVGQLPVISLQLSVISAFGASLFFLLLILLTRGRGMGAGDVFLVFIFSLTIGFPQSLLMVFLSFVLGGLVSATLLLTGQKKFGQSLPFGPFMVSATLLTIFWGKNLLDLYLKMVLK